MLNFNVYKNSLYMMMHRGFEHSEEIIADVSKELPNDYFDNPRYRGIGHDFKKYIRSDIKDIEDRFLMSYCLVDNVTSRKSYIIFGTNTKSFLEIMASIIIDSIDSDREYKTSFNLIIPKEFNPKYVKKIDEISRRVNLQRHIDFTLMKPPHHALGPTYSLLTDEEASSFLKEIRITKRQAKKVLSTDPMIRFLGFTPGNLVRIHRTPNIKGSLIKNTLDYRFVV